MKARKILTIIFGLIFILSALWASGEPDESATTSSAKIISSAVSITVCISAALILRKLNEEERGK